ncbi:uncharacterized protein PY1_contig-04-332 [Novosphingobium sp. PY1]|nr:uncharacterized protein PY1_contig-04-332 [Novosphingobium sp. PY1]
MIPFKKEISTMSQRLSHEQLQQLARITDAPVRTRVERNFGLPTGLYVATVALYLGFIGVMASLFMNPELAIPMVVFAGFVVFAFGLAGYWAKMKPDNDTAPLTWGQFGSRGIDTLSGRLTASEAAIQVLMLPVLILGWGLAVAVIVAFT